MSGIIPEAIGRFKLIEVAAMGGMTTIYRGVNTEDGQAVAVKVLPEVFGKREEMVERFKREARVYMTLSHESIPKVYDFGVANGRYYLVMEWIDGIDLQRWISQRSALPGNPAWIDIFSGICRGVDAAHFQGILHRDLSARNVIVLPNGHVRIADFGLSKLVEEAHFTITGEVLGTPHYSAPEQIESSKDVTASADIWSLGVLGYQIATGQIPFDGENHIAVIRKILDPNIEFIPPRALNPLLSVRSESVIIKCLRRELSGRYRKVIDILSDLEGHPDVPVEDMPAPRVGRRRRSYAPAVAAVVAILAASLLSYLWLGRAAPPAPEPAPAFLSANPSPAKINLNAAGRDELKSLAPILSEDIVNQIILIREMSGPIDSLDDLVKMPGLSDDGFQSLRARAFAGPPAESLPKRRKVNLNKASFQELRRAMPVLRDLKYLKSPWHSLSALIWYRKNHGPYKSLEDVAQVTGFPATGKRYWLVSKVATVE